MSTPTRNRGGVLSVHAAATRKAASARPANRGPAPRLRTIIRRLPPGLTESEFWVAIGEEWQIGKGKVDLATFKEGKVSKDPAKPSRPGRAYLRVKDQVLLDSLSAHVKATTFQDAKNTGKDSCLLGPPNLEFAPYNKVPTGRARHDGRQGTIDQDQEFIDFLQSLTEPIARPPVTSENEASQEKVTTTPLVQYLKDKKANKAKEAAEKKAAKQKDGKDTKEKKTATVVVKGSTPAAEKERVAKATQEAVKAINKSMAAMSANKQPPTAPKAETKPAPTAPKEASTATSPAKRERDRGHISAAARMLQRDLGLAPRSPRAARATPIPPVSAKGESASTPATTPAVKSPPPGTATVSDTPKTTVPTNMPPTGPKAARSQSAVPPKPVLAPVTRPIKPLPNPSPGAKSAFLKHANPSQGVTEELLRTAFEAFGTVTRCEIDKKKGLGHVDFGDTETLRKAMHASPIKVGNGNVVVLENRNVKKAPPVPANATAPAASSPAPKVAVVSPPANSPVPMPAAQLDTSAEPAAEPVPPAEVKPADTAAAPTEGAATPAPQPSVPTSTPFTPSPPKAPRGIIRGGGRGSMRSNPLPRGNFAPNPRGAIPRGGGFRGGRGSFGPRGGRAAAQAIAAANTTANTNTPQQSTTTSQVSPAAPAAPAEK